MATFAPADALLYLESNNPADVFAALTNTDAWKLVDDITGKHTSVNKNSSWSRMFVRWTGLGPINSVIITRAQLAVVVTDLGVAENGETLTVKPEGALLVETHTSASRIKPSVEQALKNFAETAYGQPTLKRTNLDGFEFIEWIAPGGSRQIVATISGSLVIVGNTERAVQKILAVAIRRKPSLKDDTDLQRLRLELKGDQALAFGYIPARNSGHLLSIAVPMVMGRAPGNTEFERLINAASAKIVTSLGWSSTPLMNGIVDRYRINLHPAVVAKLKEDFSCQQLDPTSGPVLPADLSSVTYYQFQNPTSAWQGLKTSVSAQVDALSAILFSSLLKSALIPYGINEPDKFLNLVDRPLLTARLDSDISGSLLIARVRDQSEMRELLVKGMGFHTTQGKPNAETLINNEGDFAASLVGNFVVIGSQPSVAEYIAQSNSGSRESFSTSPGTFLIPLSTEACILTYSKDTDRVRTFVSTVLEARGIPVRWSDQTEHLLTQLPYAATETTLHEQGIERVTRSSLGQFSTLLPLVFPERIKTSEDSKP